MKWYSIKDYSPSYDGYYIVRWFDPDNKSINISYILWDGCYWLDFSDPTHSFQGLITHFCMPDPVEIKIEKPDAFLDLLGR